MKSPPRVTGRLPPRMRRCVACGLHVMPDAKACPHCGADVVKLWKKQDRALKKLEAAHAKLREILARSGSRG